MAKYLHFLLINGSNISTVNMIDANKVFSLRVRKKYSKKICSQQWTIYIFLISCANISKVDDKIYGGEIWELSWMIIFSSKLRQAVHV